METQAGRFLIRAGIDRRVALLTFLYGFEKILASRRFLV